MAGGPKPGDSIDGEANLRYVAAGISGGGSGAEKARMALVSRFLLVVVGVALVAAGVVWMLLAMRNLPEFQQAGGIVGAVIFGGLPGVSAAGTGLFLIRLAAARFPGSV